MTSRRSALLFFFVALGPACASRVPPVAPGATQSTATIRDTHEDLQAVLWMQTAAEYRALTMAIYAQAVRRLEVALQDTSWTAALEQREPYQSLPPAVILDLDETVLDSMAFQGQLVRDRRPYSEDAWADWVRARQAAAVPGALGFLAAAHERGIAVFFVSNRRAEEEESTLANLRSLGLDASGNALLSPGKNGWNSDKSARRAFVAARYRVLLLVGDDLGDLVPVATLTPAERATLVERYPDRWLERWVLPPNPVYGSWSRALTPGLTTDNDVLERKLAAVRGYR